MHRIRVAALSVVIALASVLWSVTPASAHPVESEVTYYLSLGDSLAQGVQPVGPPDHDNNITDQGYPDQLYTTLKVSNPLLQLAKIGCPGETSATLVNGGGPCAANYGGASQLAAAVQFLDLHRGHVSFVTINIGSNDVLGCVGKAGIDTACTLGQIQTVKNNLGTTLKTLRDNLDKRSYKAAGMTYYDPLLASWTSDRALANQSLIFTNLLNAAEAATYLRYGFRVAPVSYAFQTNNLRVLSGSSVPVSVTEICRLTYMCDPVAGPNIHANKAGYKLIADTFAQVLRW